MKQVKFLFIRQEIQSIELNKFIQIIPEMQIILNQISFKMEIIYIRN